jgi:hypothetical protein
MRLLIATMILGFAMSLVPFPAKACPYGQDRVKLAREIVSGWDNAQTSPSVVDYVSFLESSDNLNQCLVLVSLTDQGLCHACGATISILEFSGSGKEWRRTFEQRDALNMGSFGRAPVATLLKLGKSGPALQFQLGGMHFGYAGKTLVLATKIEGQYKEVLLLQTHHDNRGSGEDETWEWDAKTEFVEGNAEFPDIRVSYSGTEKRNEKIEPVNRSETYRFSDGQYKKVAPEPDLTHK